MIPASSPLATGWRAELCALILAHGRADVLDAVSAYAELRARHVEGQSGLFDRMEAREIARPARSRTAGKMVECRLPARATATMLGRRPA
jgi:hypothetical protein